ncbi:MAG: capsular biosynthesis protein, partial [Desulfosarcina sp.]
MNLSRLQPLANQRVLLLQGPMGPFFNKLDRHLRANGSQTFRICFNGGDRLFANDDNRVDYRGKPHGWRTFLTDFCTEKKIQAMIVYGDYRFYHLVAKDVATASGIQFLVFEEGYLRPNFVTLEKNGVNANSSLPRQASFYRQLKPGPTPER